MDLNFDPRQPESAPPKPLRTIDDQARTVRRIGLVVLVVLVAVLIWSLGRDGDSDSAPARTRLEIADAVAATEYVDVRDDGRTLLIDGDGEQGVGANVTAIGSVLGSLNVPDSVVARMASTRALDGMQEASWDGLTATWTYHPDDGLDIIITD